MKKFIHFGCWNKGGCSFSHSQELNNLSRVMKNLREVCEDETTKPEFVVVAGDNYYPDKLTLTTGEKKITGKNIKTSDLESGLECLPDNVPVNIILGNHDVESDVLVDHLIPDGATSFPEVPEQQKCYILDKEIEFARSRRENGTRLDVYTSRLFNNKTLVLMVNTTLYYDQERIGLKCYRHLYDNNNLTLSQLRRDQKIYIEQIMSTLNDKIKNIVIIGHDPIICYKVKGGQTRIFTSPGYNLINLIYDSIYKKIGIKKDELNLYYLCADLHQYQIGSINIVGEDGGSMHIKQYIVGTGGTELDPYPFTLRNPSNPQQSYNMYGGVIVNPSNDLERYNIEYSLTDEQIMLSGSKYGFLECYDINGSLAFNFIDTENNNVRESIYNYLPIVQFSRRKIKRKNNKNNIIKGGGILNDIIDIPDIDESYIHDGNINYERLLDFEKLNTLLSNLEQYKDGLVYISLGSADSNDRETNSENHLIPSFVLQRDNIDFCKKGDCKILCISIDQFTPTQLEYNKRRINGNIEGTNIDFYIINIKSIFTIPFKRDLKFENLNFTYTLLNKIATSLQISNISPENLMVVNYIKFRNAERGSDQKSIEWSIPIQMLCSFGSHGYENSLYDWFGYVLNLKLQNFIYKTKLILIEDIKALFTGMGFLSHTKINQLLVSQNLSLYQIKNSLSAVAQRFLKFIYPIYIHSEDERSLINRDFTVKPDNNFTYSVADLVGELKPLTKSMSIKFENISKDNIYANRIICPPITSDTSIIGGKHTIKIKKIYNQKKTNKQKINKQKINKKYIKNKKTKKWKKTKRN
jgi:hypothetical protein